MAPPCSLPPCALYLCAARPSQVGFFEGWKGREPTPDQCLSYVAKLVLSTGRRPAMLATDVEAAVPVLQRVLGPLGIHCGYYPPPSAEETFNMGMGMPEA